MSAVDRQYGLLLRLLFAAEARQRLDEDPEGLLLDAGLTGGDGALFRALDREGLAIDAEGRRRYLMSALCRSFPLTSAALGAAPGGAERLAAFLASPALFGPLAARTAAFGDHLARLVELGAAGDRAVAALLTAVLAFERGLVDNAIRIRAAVEAGRPVAAPERYSASRIERGRPALAPYTLVVQLPCAPAVLSVALGRVGSKDAWHRIDSGRLDPDRVRSVARAEPTPVTVIARGVVRGVTVSQGGAGGVAPLVDVSHITVELSGLQAARLNSFDGETPTAALPEADRALARQLVEAGVLYLR